MAKTTCIWIILQGMMRNSNFKIHFKTFWFMRVILAKFSLNTLIYKHLSCYDITEFYSLKLVIYSIIEINIKRLPKLNNFKIIFTVAFHLTFIEKERGGVFAMKREALISQQMLLAWQAWINISSHLCT